MRDPCRSSTSADGSQRERAFAGDWIEGFARASRRGLALLSADGELLESSARARELLGALEGAREVLRGAAREAAGEAGARSEEGSRIELGTGDATEPLVLELFELRLGDGGGAGAPAYLVSVRTRAELAGEDANLVLADRMRRLEESAPAIAHDLRGPLNAIGLNVELVERLADGGEASELVAHARIVKLELARLNRLLQALLAETGAGIDEPRLFDLRASLGEVAERARARRRPPIELELELPDEPVRLLAPPGALRQVLLDLVVNAVEASGTGGAVRVELSSAGGEAVVAIVDSGPGLMEAELAPLGRPPRVRADGSGLGLFVARTLVERLGGWIAFGRGEGGGARVELRLPSS